MEILNKYRRYGFFSHLFRDKYWDFVLSLEGGSGTDIDGRNVEKCLSAFMDTNDPYCIGIGDTLVSKKEYTWPDAVNSGCTLLDIGITGVDNGLLKFDKDTIGDDMFMNLFLGSSQLLVSGDTRLFLNPVTGNTKQYVYPYDIVSGSSDGTYYSFRGGFLQGYYRLHGFGYSVLPQYIEDEWNMEFVIRPRSEASSGNTLNAAHPDNAGTFFYMGTRAENKFIRYYGADGGDPRPVEGWMMTSDGKLFNSTEEYTIVTDNKYLLFDRTCDGVTVRTFDEDAEYAVEGAVRHDKGENLYTIVNRTQTGKTACDLRREYYRQSGRTDYDMMKDVYGNAFSLRVRDDGSIGYRYLVRDCDAEEGYRIIEEYSFPGIVKKDEWSTINVKYAILNGSVDPCGVPYEGRKMKIYIYVNGYLKLVSIELPEFSFHELDDSPERQEGVPFNISLGGGTQGLCDVIYDDYRNIYGKLFPIEKHFAGTFDGDLRIFKFYSCKLVYNEIKNNYLYSRTLFK